METDVLRNFIKMHVEVLVAGVWIDGLMGPIVKSVVTLLPVGVVAEFYGPTALKTEVIQAIRQVRSTPPSALPVAPEPPVEVRSTVQSGARRGK